MIKAILKNKNTRKKEKIELPDTADAGDIIYVISKAMRNSDYKYFNYEHLDDWIDREIFEIALEDGRIYHCYEVVINKYRLYVEYFDEEGLEYYCIADFMLGK